MYVGLFLVTQYIFKNVIGILKMVAYLSLNTDNLLCPFGVERVR